MKVLIVEDNASMRQLMRSMVAALAEEVFECVDGVEALAAYTRHMPDWVLMDLEMPKLDGIAATLEIKAVFPQARVVIVTQYDDAKLRRSAQSAGACGYVLKENLLGVLEILRAGQRRSDHEN
jgi:CheY-like chemotaxis protein